MSKNILGKRTKLKNNGAMNVCKYEYIRKSPFARVMLSLAEWFSYWLHQRYFSNCKYFIQSKRVWSWAAWSVKKCFKLAKKVVQETSKLYFSDFEIYIIQVISGEQGCSEQNANLARFWLKVKYLALFFFLLSPCRNPNLFSVCGKLLKLMIFGQ